jgi:iron complex outermembrane receptor protein
MLALLLPLAAGLAAPAAMAQGVDYGALEQLFGESVTTSATGQPQRATEAPAAMEIVDADRIRRSGALHLPGVLKQVPGVDVLQWGSSSYDVSIRGYNQAFSPRLLVLVDGRQVYADHYGYTPWTAIPTEMSAIRQIEVVKGPNTALFGFNAVSGVINIITFNPLHDDVDTVSVTGGSLGTVQGSAVVTFQEAGRWGLRLSGSAGLDNDFSTPRSGVLPRLQNSRGAVNANGVMQVNEHVQFSLDLSHSQTRNNQMGPVYSSDREQHQTSSIKGQLNADTGFGLVQLTAYTNWIEEKLEEEFGAINFENQSTVLQLQDVARVGENHILRGALEYRRNQVNTSPVAGGQIFYDVMSASFMWNWTVTPGLSLTNAVRFDSLGLGRTGTVPAGYPFNNSDWDRGISAWSFNSGLVWQAGADDTLRLLFSRGIQLPDLASLGGVVLTNPFFNATGSPHLRTAAVMNYELGWDHRIGAIDTTLRTAVFWQKNTDLFGLAGGIALGPPLYSLTSNIGNSDAIGGEISLSGAFSADWRWDLAYRLESITDKFLPSARNAAAFDDFQHTTPRHQVKAGLEWRRGAWEARMAVYYQSATDGIANTLAGGALVPLGSYANMDARIAYRVNDRVTLALSGDNLLQDRQRQNIGPEIERRVLVSLAVSL